MGLKLISHNQSSVHGSRFSTQIPVYYWEFWEHMAQIKLNKIPLLNMPPYGLKHIDPNSTHGSYLSKQYALNKRHAPNSSGMATI